MRWRFGSVQRTLSRPVHHRRHDASSAVAIALLTLFDHDTIRLDSAMSRTADVGKWLKFHTSAPVVMTPPFVVSRWSATRVIPALDRFSVWCNGISDRSTTVILQVESLTDGRAFELRGPASMARLCCALRSSSADCSNGRHQRPSLFPRGIDVVLVHDDGIKSRYSAPRGWSGEAGPNGVAVAPSRTPIGCWRMSAVATATFPRFFAAQIPSNWRSASTAATEGSPYDRERTCGARDQAGARRSSIEDLPWSAPSAPRRRASALPEPVDTGEMRYGDGSPRP